MSDPVVTATPTPAAAPEVPVVEAPASIPEPAPQPAPPPAEPKVEVKPAEVIPPPPPASLLKEAEKPAEKPAEAKPTEPSSAPESVSYEPFKLPEGLAVNDKEMSSYVDVLKEFKAPQELGQRLIDLHLEELNKIASFQQEQWRKTLDTWKNDTLSDPELGGNRLQTVLTRCQGVLNEFADKDLRDMIESTGLGNHRSFVRFLNKVAGFVSEPRAIPNQGAKPVPDIKPSRAQRRYGRANGAQPPAGN